MESGCAAGTGEVIKSPNNRGAGARESKAVLEASCGRVESFALPATGSFATSLCAFKLAWKSAAKGDDCCGDCESNDSAPGPGAVAGNRFEMERACIQSFPRSTAPGDIASNTPQRHGLE